MGYYIFAVGIDEEKLNKAIHSKDESLFKKVIATQSFKQYAKSFSLLEDALRALIFDTPLDQKYAHLYGYAFICLSQHLGLELPHQEEMKFGYETDLIDEYIKSDFNVDFTMTVPEILLNGAPELPFAEPEDWPMWGMLSIKQIPEFLQKIEHINIQEEDLEALEEGDEEESEDKWCAYNHLAGIKQNIQFCLDNNVSLLSFCH